MTWESGACTFDPSTTKGIGIDINTCIYKRQSRDNSIQYHYNIISPVDTKAEETFPPKMSEKSLPGLKFELVQSHL